VQLRFYISLASTGVESLLPPAMSRRFSTRYTLRYAQSRACCVNLFLRFTRSCSRSMQAPTFRGRIWIDVTGASFLDTTTSDNRAARQLDNRRALKVQRNVVRLCNSHDLPIALYIMVHRLSSTSLLTGTRSLVSSPTRKRGIVCLERLPAPALVQTSSVSSHHTV